MTTAPVDELAFAGLRALADRLAAGELSSRELTERTLSRIEATQPTLNAFRCVRVDASLHEADDADRRLAAGERTALLGVPVAIKDDTDLAGETTPFGCAGEWAVSEQDAEVVRRLKAAGAVIVGKTNSPEFGQWPITEGSAFGVTRNPWNTDHTPGGSSGGSAAAVAAGLVPVALGSDGLGSIRIPAAWTHLVGIKPQRGRISTWPAAESFNGLTCFGPLARTVADASTLLDAAAGNQPGDLHRPSPPPEPFAAAALRADPGRLRIAVSLKPPFSGPPSRLDPELRAAVERVAGVLAALGHDVVAAELPYGYFGANVVPRSMAGLGEWGARVPDPSLLDPRTLATMRLGRLMSGPVLRLARALERPMRAQLSPIFKRYDVVLAPTTALPPFPVGAIDGLSDWATTKAMVAACPYAWPWNALGWPGINVPAGFVGPGLPVGAQLLGPGSSESLLIALAAQLEAVERWHERRPTDTVPAGPPSPAQR